MHFNSSYNQKEFLRILQTKICPNFVQDIKPMQFERQTKYFVKDNMYQLGKIKFDDDTEVVVMEIQQTSISDPRITLTKDAFKILHDHQKDNALIVFHSADTDSWRLSLLTSKYEGWDKINSNAKRYSFLLGSHEKVKTPNDYLIKKGIVKDLSDLISRFDVEVVRKEFFKQYLNLFLELYKELKIYESAIGKDNDLVTFTKTLMGKIIFLYFIQKKGRLGVETDKHWGHGKKDFIKFLFDDYKGPRNLHKGEVKCSFYNDYLEPLFYEALSNERTTDVYERFGLKIPYLNGGLFEQEYDWKNTFVNPKDEIFERIIDVFDRYNFTIHEDDPYDREVAVDPEMLGKIFETMISVSKDNIQEICDMYEKAKAKSKDPDKIISVDVGKELNKKFGAFYTPREIVHYMTKESLTYYLINGVKEARPNESEEQIEKIFRELFRLKDDHLLKEEAKLSPEEFQLFEQYVILTNDLLKKIKVLDPAVGSGAFPMGILHEIFGLRRYLIDAFELKFESDYEIKKSIIQNNIYGVDIEPGAIDIARLRFWLSLVVDADKPEPLPNLDFKFVCANTLIPLEESRLFTSHDVIAELNQIQKQYFNCQSKKEKEELKKKFEQTKLRFWGADEGKRTFNTTKEYKQHITDIAGKATDLRNKQIMNWDPFDTKKSGEFFDSELIFGSDLFDIIIGNPPYLRQEEFKEIKENLKKTFGNFFNGRADLYTFFIKLGFNILKEKGVLCYITSNKFFVRGYGENTRDLLSRQVSLKQIINFGELPVFEAAVDSSIILAQNTGPSNDGIVEFVQVKNASEIHDLSVFFKMNKGIVENSSLGKGSRSLGSPAKLLLLKKLVTNKLTFGEYYNNNIFAGLKTGLDNVYVIGRSFRDKLLNADKKYEIVLKPWLRGKDVKKWNSIFHDLWVINFRSSSNFKRPWSGMNDIDAEDIFKLEYPLLYDYLVQHKEQIGKRSDQGNYWRELRSCAYDSKFDTKKIIYPDCAKEMRAAYDDTGLYGTLAMYIVDYDPLIMGILNSNVFDWYSRMTFATFGDPWKGGRVIFKTIYMSQVPIPDIKPTENEKIVKIVEDILNLRKNDPNADISELEQRLNQIIYKLYELTDEEVRVIEERMEK